MDNMDYGSHYDVVDQNGSHMVPEPTVKDFIIWLLIPSVLSFFTCGIGSLILLIVWACSGAVMMKARQYDRPLILLIVWTCSGSNRVRSNFAKAQLLVMLISLALAFFVYIFFGAALIGISGLS